MAPVLMLMLVLKLEQGLELATLPAEVLAEFAVEVLAARVVQVRLVALAAAEVRGCPDLDRVG